MTPPPPALPVTEGAARLELEEGAGLTAEQGRSVIAANAAADVVIVRPGLRVTVPAGTLRTGDDAAAVLPAGAALPEGDVVVCTQPDGACRLVVLSLVGEEVSYVAETPGTYEVIHNAKAFEDVKAYWAAPAIDFTSARGLFRGTSETLFEPDAPATRAMIFAVLARLRGVEIPPAQGEHWYEGSLRWAVEEGYTDGLRPLAPVTRQELLTMLWRWAGKPAGGELTGFADADRAAGWAREALAWAASAGILTGRADGRIDPAAPATRAETAVFLRQFITGLVNR